MNISLADQLKARLRPLRDGSAPPRPLRPKNNRELRDECIRNLAGQGVSVREIVERLHALGVAASAAGVFASMELWEIDNGEVGKRGPAFQAKILKLLAGGEKRRDLEKEFNLSPDEIPAWAACLHRAQSDLTAPEEFLGLTWSGPLAPSHPPKVARTPAQMAEFDPLGGADLFRPEKNKDMDDRKHVSEQRRERAFDLLAQGESITAAAKGSGTQVNQVYAWLKKHGAEEGRPDAVRTMAVRETEAFQDHVQDRLSDGVMPEDICREYELSPKVWARLEKLHAARALLILPAIAEAEVLQPDCFRYEDDIPLVEEKTRPLLVLPLREFSDGYGEEGGSRGMR
jgi:hypothetical protein